MKSKPGDAANGLSNTQSFIKLLLPKVHGRFHYQTFVFRFSPPWAGHTVQLKAKGKECARIVPADRIANFTS